MHRDGHYGAALLAYAPVGFLVAAGGFPTLALAGIGVAGALAMVPDLDMRVPGIKHRGPTHTVGFAVLVGLVVGAAGVALATGGEVRSVSGALGTLGTGPLAVGLGGFGFLVGFVTTCSHIAADALTPMGVTPFWPLSGRHVSLSVARASNPVANRVLLAVGIAAAAGAYGLATV